ncbi:hypothetical protein VPNG_00180 [Cytospora leucostoma]|uniref:FAD/NAD(P)-binding domain-containing protein n=1 Tax=Cytospora leucostoma TaxID=1230097 RepID=A0A423XNB4_9PEZI|nr:hypothetical protein VPNG_00180 [Cytospora leucostoma]
MASLLEDFPPEGELLKMQEQYPLPNIAPGTVDPAGLSEEEATKQALAALSTFNAALESDNAEGLAGVFYDSQAFWRDQLALTYHIRTFASPSVVAAALLETKKLRGWTGGLKLVGTAKFAIAGPTLQFIDLDVSFRTSSPAATCRGRVTLLPVKSQLENGVETLSWKLWILSTILENLDVHPENEALLKSPNRQLEGLEKIETDVFIIGAGNAAVSLAARLKALGVDSVCAERNAHIGDNWALRYDCMKFHLPTSCADMAYLGYPEELRGSHLLNREDLANQVRRYVSTLGLNVITSAIIKAVHHDQSANRWIINFETPAGERTAVAKHLVQATGLGSQIPYRPQVADEHLYKGISIHSTRFKSGKELREKGAKSVLVVGSANTAFDVLEDCHAAGLKTTMNLDQGLYDWGVEAGDRVFHTWPQVINSQWARNHYTHLASEEPDRYAKLAAAGFPVLDSRPEHGTSLLHHLLERGGGHYVDTGGSKLLADGECAIKARVEPVAFTETGVRFSDGSTLDVDAVVWCTGFADKNVRRVAAEILGGGPSAQDIASRLESTWRLDQEGELRGIYKRQQHIDNYWVAGGFTSQHRWYSRILALQIKAGLEGLLPPAYRDTPNVEALRK